MGLEAGTYILDLVASNPIGGDQKQQGDDHLRLIKNVLRNTFPDADMPFRRPKALNITGDASPLLSAQNTIYNVDATSAAVTITLPDSLTIDHAGWEITAQKMDNSANAVVFEPGALQINGLDNIRISTQWTTVRLYWTGSTWRAYYSFGHVVDQDPLQDLINRIIPAGVGWVDWGLALPDGGYAYSYGQTLLRATYPALFARIGTIYGAGDGSTTFVVPDSRGRVIAGQDDMGGTSANRLTNPGTTVGGVDGDTLGATGGEEVHVLTEEELAEHIHDSPSPVDFNPRDGGGTGLFWNTLSAIKDLETGPVGEDVAHNNVQPTIIGNHIMKVH